MSHIPPIICDTPPPIDFADSQDDDFGDGMFSNYDGLSLPTTPKQTLSTNNDLPDLPELPNVNDVSLTSFDGNFKHLNESREYADLPLPSISELQSNDSSHNEMPPPFIESTASNSEIENSSSETNDEDALEKSVTADDKSNSPIKHFNKLSIEPKSLDNSTSSQSNSNDNVYRSESPPSLVFSTGSLNCDDNRSEDFDEFPPNVDEVESNLPSLKLDSGSDSKSQSSDLEEVNNSVAGEFTNDIKNDDEIKLNERTTSIEVLNSLCEAKINVEAEVGSQSISIVNNSMTNYDDSFDDFVEYEDVITKEKAEHHQELRDKSEELNFDDENSFAADFSQFEAFSEQKVNESLECNFKDNYNPIDELSDDHINNEEPLTLSKLSISEENVHEHDDDEFGEFNDFSDFSKPITAVSSLTIDIEELSTKIKPLLDMLFPISDSQSEDDNFDALDLTNDTTNIIKDFENSKALDHQWLSSVGKTSLVTALGIDSRNILYGGKWNNSMPRFAANLGFSPLEPMKSGTMSGTTSSTINAVASNEIPAAQFDWNSSGLVNPLDASHAHTLLLDLEQLVVVANLDKIKLDSSTCSSTTVAVTTNSTTNNNSMSSLNNHYIHNWDADGVGYQYGDFYGNSLPYSCETNIKTLGKNTNHFGLFDQFLDIRVQEILHKTNVAENQSARIELDWNSTKTEPSIIAPAPPLSNITTTLNIKSNSFAVDEEETQTSASYVVPGSSGTLKETHIFTPSKSSYATPQSRDIPNDKHETKFVDFDYEKAAAGIIIDENVVKKEYRDVEYNPDKPVTSTLSCDDFSDFQSVPIPTTTQIPPKHHQNILPIDFGILQPTKSNDVVMINWPGPGNVIDSADLESFDNFKPVDQPFSDSKRSSIDFRSIGKLTSSSSTFSEFSKPVIGVSPSEIMFQKNSSSLEDEFSDFQCVEPTPSIAHHVTTDPKCNNLSSPLQNSIPSLTNLSNKSDANSTVAPNLHSWTNYQSPMSTTTVNVPAAILKPEPLSLQILTPQPVNPLSTLPTNTIWPESEIDPDEIARLEAIFPQAQKSSSNPMQATTPIQAKSSECKLENRIPQPSSTLQEDDEWSDFISVQTTASHVLPITNIISANIAKHQQDDDEWSDFVSSASSTSQPSIQSWNLNSGPNFTSWNAPPQFDSWQSSTMYQPSPHQFVPTIPAMMNNNNNATTLPSNQSTSVNTKSSQNSFFTQKAPSISLIPDLSFVAAKSLVNRSRTNFQNK